jgi:Ca2+/Na+ antiporter
MSKNSRPPVYFVLGGIFYALLVGYMVHLRAWAAASGVFVYGLALVLGVIYQQLKGQQR